MEEIKIAKIEDVLKLRHEVMWPHMDLEYVRVEGDSEAIHFGYFIDNQLISCISLFIKKDRGQFRKFATKKNYQNKGIGSKLLNHLITYSKNIGLKSIFCNGRVEKLNFYKKFGLIETKEEFVKGGKSYKVLSLNL